MRMRLSGGTEVEAEAAKATAAVEETEAATAKANKSAARTGNGIRSSLTKQISSIRTIGRALTKYVTIPLAAVAIGSGVMAAHFDRSMNLVATDAGGSVKEVGRLKGEVLDLARHSQFGPQALADSLFHVESSGYRGAKALRVLNEAQRLATTGNSDLQSTTYALVSATKALYGESLKNVNRTAAELNGIVAHGDMRLEELTSAMSTGVIPKAKAMGLTLRDVGAAMDVMTARGIPAQRAAYALGFTLQKLVPYGEKAEKAFASIGLGQETLINAAQHGKYGYVSALELLQHHLDRLPTKAQQTKVIEEMFGGGRMTSGLLTNLQNLGEMRKIYGELGDEVQKYNAHVHEAENQPMVRAQRAWSSVQASLIEIGQVLLPAAIPLMETVANLVSGIGTDFAHLSPSAQHTVVTIGLIAAALGPVLLLVAKLLELWKAIREISLVSAAAGGLGELRAATSLAAGGELGGFGMMSKAGKFTTGAIGVGAAQIGGQMIGGKVGNAVSNIGTGAALGFGIGGPWGAAAGAGLGATATIVEELLSSHKVDKLKAQTEHLSKAMGEYRRSMRGVAAGEKLEARTKQGLQQANKAEATARHRLTETLIHFGAGSRQANQAQLALARSERDVTRAAKAEQNAHQLSGNRLQLYRIRSLAAVAAIKQSIPVLKHRIKTLNEENDAGKLSTKGLQRLVKMEGSLESSKIKLTAAYAKAESLAGKPWAHRLGQLTALQAQYGRQGHTLIGVMREQREHMAQLKAMGLTQQYRDENRELEKQVRLYEKLIETSPHVGGNLGKTPAPAAIGRPHHRNTAAPEETNGSKTVAELSRSRGKGGKVHHVPVVFALDPKGRRTLATGVVEVQEDEDAIE